MRDGTTMLRVIRKMDSGKGVSKRLLLNALVGQGWTRDQVEALLASLDRTGRVYQAAGRVYLTRKPLLEVG